MDNITRLWCVRGNLRFEDKTIHEFGYFWAKNDIEAYGKYRKFYTSVFPDVKSVDFNSAKIEKPF